MTPPPSALFAHLRTTLAAIALAALPAMAGCAPGGSVGDSAPVDEDDGEQSDKPETTDPPPPSAPMVCDGALDTSDPMSFARAIELCDWVQSATFNGGAPPTARNIVDSFGNVYTPRAGSTMMVLSTGVAVDARNPAFVDPDEGTPFLNSGDHPLPQPNPNDGCGQADPAQVLDFTEYTMKIQVPKGATALSFDFNFMSGEFPEWVCTEYDDTFLALLESQSFDGNISFDERGRPATINVGFFDVCSPELGRDCQGDEELAGTGFGGDVGGGTGWLTTTAPVTAGETITLRFAIFDEGDPVYDSTVLIDNFRWDNVDVDDPITIELTR